MTDDEGEYHALFTSLEAEEPRQVFSAALHIVRQKVYQACIRQQGLRVSDMPAMLSWKNLGRGHLTLDFNTLGSAAGYYTDLKSR